MRTAVAALVLALALLPHPSAAQEGAREGPVPPEEADAVRDTLSRPAADHGIGLGDVLAFPFDVVGLGLRLVLDGTAEAVGWLAAPPRREAAVAAYRTVRRAGFRPAVATDLGPRSGPSAELAWVGLAPLRLESALSVRGYRRHRASVEWGVRGWTVGAGVGFRRWTEERFRGVGPHTGDEPPTDFLQDRWSVEASASWAIAPSWRLEVGGGWQETTVGPGRDEGTPDVQGRFEPDELPGLGRTRFAVARARLEHDGRAVTALWTDGLRAGLDLRGYRGLRDTRVDFGTAEARASFSVPFSRLRHLTLRGRVETSLGGENRIPFTHLPSLGGGGTLRGYERRRFRARTVVSASAEWRWELWRDLRQRGRVHGLLFVDAGAAGSSPADLAGVGDALGLGLGGRWRGTVVEGWLAFGDHGTRIGGTIRSEPW